MFEERKNASYPVIYKALHSVNTKISVHIPFVKGTRQELKALLDGGHVDFDTTTKRWEMASHHIETVAEYLRQKFGMVELQIMTSTTEVCTTSCQTANPKSTPVSKCECVCGGHGHAGGWPEGWKLASAQGDLLVKGNRKVEIFTLHGELLKGYRSGGRREDNLPKGVTEIMWGGRPAYAFDEDTDFSRWIDEQELR